MKTEAEDPRWLTTFAADVERATSSLTRGIVAVGERLIAEARATACAEAAKRLLAEENPVLQRDPRGRKASPTSTRRRQSTPTSATSAQIAGVETVHADSGLPATTKIVDLAPSTEILVSDEAQAAAARASTEAVEVAVVKVVEDDEDDEDDEDAVVVPKLPVSRGDRFAAIEASARKRDSR